MQKSNNIKTNKSCHWKNYWLSTNFEALNISSFFCFSEKSTIMQKVSRRALKITQNETKTYPMWKQNCGNIDEKLLKQLVQIIYK